MDVPANNQPGALGAETPIDGDLRARIIDGSVFELIDRRLGQDADAPLAQAFVEAFDRGGLSLLALLSTPAFEALQSFRFWQVQHFLIAVIPKLDAIEPLEMVQAIERIVQQGGQDGAAGLPFDALRSWFRADITRAADLVARVRDGGIDVSAAALVNALIALDDPILARDLMQALPTREAAICAVAEMPHDTAEARTELVDALKVTLADEADDRLRSLAFDSLVRVYNAAEAALDELALALAVELLSQAGDQTLYRAATMPFAYRKAMTPDVVAALLLALRYVKAEHRGTLDMLDASLITLSEDDRFSEAATAFVTAVVTRPAPRLSLDAFDGWFRTLLTGPPERFHAILADWLLNGSAEARHELSKSLPLDDLSGMPLEIDFTRLDLTNKEQLVVCLRGVSWFFIHPVTAISLAVSALRSASPELARDLCELIYDPLLVNYGGAAYTYLSNLPDNDPAHPFVGPLLARADQYLADLRSTGDLPELRPSEHERFLERTRYVDAMAKAMKAAESKSVFADLFPKSILLYGRTAVVSVRTTDGQDRHQEIPMQSISHSHELPRRDICDPVGLDWQLRAMKAARVAP